MAADPDDVDVVIVGGGHNGLVAAAYLARAGLRVRLLERLRQVGGAAVSAQLFDGVDARLSRYAYLISLLPAAPTAGDIAWRMLICGIGFGFFNTPNNRALLLSAPPPRAGAASGMQATARLVLVPGFVSHVEYQWEDPLTSTVKDLVTGSGIQFRDNGVHALKGVPGDWHLYAVEGGRAP